MNEREVFAEAMQKPTVSERAAFLERVCGADAALRQRIEVLIAEQDQLGSFLESPPTGAVNVDSGATLSFQHIERPGAQIGPYKLLQQIGEGGMGVVYMAEQHQPVMRRVALKIIKPGMDTRQVIARFEAERQALAMMDHPSIAKVFDAGATSTGRPYFVMELVKGVPITQYCDQQHLTPRQRLELFIPVCQAIQHAHQKGIIHRDLKPSNVLIALYDGWPVAKVIDFGVAKATSQRLTEKTMFTEYGQIVGTLEYMSPEQAELSQLDIDTRSDIYSLGVMLYELLTGTTPFEKKRVQSAAFHEILRMIREEEPPRPSTRLSTTDQLPSIAANRGTAPQKLSGLMRGELDWIVMKALDKDRSRRYETATGLARDIERYLHDEPVLACPPSAAYQLRKYIRRHRGLVAAAGAIVLTVLLGAIGTTAGLMRAAWDRSAKETADKNAAASDKLAKAATKAEGEAKAALTRAQAAERDLKIASHFSRARAFRTSGQPGQRFKCLEELAAAVKLGPPPKVLKEMRNEAIAALALTDLRPIVLDEHNSEAADGIDVNFEHICRVDRQEILRVIRVADQKVVAQWPMKRPHEPTLPIAFTPDGHHLVYTTGKTDTAHQVIVCETATGAEKHVFDGYLLHISRDGMRCATLMVATKEAAQTNVVQIFDLATGKMQKRLELGPPNGEVSINADLRYLAFVERSQLRIWDVNAATAIATIAEPTGAVDVLWDEAGRFLTYRNYRREIKVWDRIQRRFQMASDPPRNWGFGAWLSPRGDLLATSDANTSLRLWDASLGVPLISVNGSSWRGQFSASGRLVGTTRVKSQLLAWEISNGSEIRRMVIHTGSPEDQPRLALDAQRMLLAGGIKTGGIMFWDLRTGQELVNALGGQIVPTFDPSDGSLLTAGGRGLHRWPVSVERVAGLDEDIAHVRVGPPKSLGVTDVIEQMNVTPDGRYASLTCYNEPRRGVIVVNLQRPQERVEIRVGNNVRQAISPDGRWVVTGPSNSETTGTTAWDARTGEPVKQWTHEQVPGKSTAFDFSSDGKWLAISSNESLRLWKTGTWEPGITVPLEYATFSYLPGIVSFSPDNRLLAYAKSGLTLALIDRETGDEVALLPLPGPQTTGGVNLWFTPDGSHVAVGCQGLEANVWNLRKLREELARVGLDWDAPAIEPAKSPSPARIDVTIDAGNLEFTNIVGSSAQKLEQFNRWIEKEPQLVDLYYQRAGLYMSLKKFDSAEADLAHVVAAKPHDASALASHARVLTILGKDAEASQAIDSILSDEPPIGCSTIIAHECYDLATFYEARHQTADLERAYRLAQRAAGLQRDTMQGGLLGRISIGAGRFQEAASVLEKNLAATPPGSYDVHDRLFHALAIKKLGRNSEAEAELDRALERLKEWQPKLTASQIEAAHAWRDQVLLQFGRPAIARPRPPSARPRAGASPAEEIEFYSEALAKDKSDVESLRGRAAAYRSTANRQAALADYLAGLQLLPRDPEFLAQAAMLQFNTGQKAESMVQARKLLELKPEDFVEFQVANWCAQLAAFYSGQPPQSDEVKLAVALGERAVSLAPTDQVTHANLGDAYLRVERWDDAVRELSKALEIAGAADYRGFRTWVALVTAEHRRGNRQEAQAWYEKLRQWGQARDAKMTENERNIYQNCLTQARQVLDSPAWVPPPRATPQELVEFFSNVLTKDPTDADALLERASAYWQLRNFDAAAADAGAVLKSQPENPLALVMMAQAELQRGHQEDAIQAVQRLVKTTPEQSVISSPRWSTRFINARINVVGTLLNTRRPEAIALGIELAEWTVKLLPDQWGVHSWLAEDYYRLERWDDAAREFEAAIPGATVVNQPYIPWLNLAMTEHRRGNPAKAQEYLETFKKWKAENQGKSSSWTPAQIDDFQKRAEDVLKGPPGEPKRP